MIYWIISAILSAIWDNIYKKSVMLSKWKISDKYYQFIWNLFMLLILPISYIFYSFEIINLKILILLIITSSINIIAELFEQYAYKNEKMSILIPYWEFKSIFAILLWFFIFWESSIITFILAIIAWSILVVGSINFKNIKFNKYCLALMISSFMQATKFIIYWFILISISELSIMFYSSFIKTIILLIIIILAKEIYSYKRINKKMSSFILLENIVWISVTFITLFLIKELWIVQTVLIWMIYLAISMLIAFIVFKNKPTKKEFIITITITTLIWIWTLLS